MTQTRRAATIVVQLEEADRPGLYAVSITAGGKRWSACVRAGTVVDTVLEQLRSGVLERAINRIADPVPDWQSERCSMAAAQFARANVRAVGDAFKRAPQPTEQAAKLVGILTDAFDAGRRKERG